MSNAGKPTTHRACALPNCAPLLDIRRLQGASECHACGRCSGQRGAVQLIARSCNQEILQAPHQQGSVWDARLLLFGVIGLAMGAFSMDRQSVVYRAQTNPGDVAGQP